MVNKNVIQSYLLTVARYDANIYAKRILLHIVKANQDYLQGEKLSGVINIDEDLFKDREYSFDIKSILGDDEDNNYDRIIKAFHSLQDRFIQFGDGEGGSVRLSFIERVYAKKRSGIVKFRMSELMYKAFADYSKGFRKYEFGLTMSFDSVYSIRFYELMSGQKNPLTYTIEELKKMFGLDGKYKLTADFVRRVIDPAQAELNEKSPYTFTYKMNKKGRKYFSITFFPIYQPQHASEEAEQHELAKRLGSSAYLTREERTYLNEHFGMSPTEIKNNHHTFFESKKKNGDYLLNLFDKIRINANKGGAKNKIGYLISALKKDLENEKETILHNPTAR